MAIHRADCSSLPGRRRDFKRTVSITLSVTATLSCLCRRQATRDDAAIAAAGLMLLRRRDAAAGGDNFRRYYSYFQPPALTLTAGDRLFSLRPISWRRYPISRPRA